MPFKVTWLGHAAFSLAIDGVNVLVDPFLEGNPKASVTVDDVEADYIVVTHGHSDHVGDTVAIAKRTGATALSNVEIANWLGKQGVENTQGLNTGGRGVFDFGTLELTIAFHSSSLPDGSYGGMPNGIVITSKEGKSFYFAGDTSLFGDMSLIGSKSLDLAALPIGGWFTMGPEDGLKAVELLRPKAVLPLHYDTFPVIEVDAAAWAETVREQTGIKVMMLQPGESCEI